MCLSHPLASPFPTPHKLIRKHAHSHLNYYRLPDTGHLRHRPRVLAWPPHAADSTCGARTWMRSGQKMDRSERRWRISRKVGLDEDGLRVRRMAAEMHTLRPYARVSKRRCAGLKGNGKGKSPQMHLSVIRQHARSESKTSQQGGPQTCMQRWILAAGIRSR